MKSIIHIIPLLVLLFLSACAAKRSEPPPDYVLVIHGGAGTILKENMTPELESAYLDKLDEALEAGRVILSSGGNSLDAVTAAVLVMEDSYLFNAGKGAVFTAEGTHEMDAAIMDGKTLQAGAVTGVHNIRNPILAARAVMEHTPHVMLSGKGAELFAQKRGIVMEDSVYFFNQRRFDSYLKAKQKAEKHGTVGAVALDQAGNLAAATSTGGMTFKMKGRVGDTPILGAGTYADNQSCAVSGTGHGEYFMRYVVGHDISALMKYKKMSLKKAANEVIMQKLKQAGGEGGVIAVDYRGNIAMPFNTAGMYRGYVTSTGKK
ncbi:MAG: isoaspartyl peptidase/L-asparaginase, partial [bacterium]